MEKARRFVRIASIIPLEVGIGFAAPGFPSAAPSTALRTSAKQGRALALPGGRLRRDYAELVATDDLVSALIVV